jgi:hypothetical protein
LSCKFVYYIPVYVYSCGKHNMKGFKRHVLKLSESIKFSRRTPWRDTPEDTLEVTPEDTLEDTPEDTLEDTSEGHLGGHPWRALWRKPPEDTPGGQPWRTSCRTPLEDTLEDTRIYWRTPPETDLEDTLEDTPRGHFGGPPRRIPWKTT